MKLFVCNSMCNEMNCIINSIFASSPTSDMKDYTHQVPRSWMMHNTLDDPETLVLTTETSGTLNIQAYGVCTQIVHLLINDITTE